MVERTPITITADEARGLAQDLKAFLKTASKDTRKTVGEEFRIGIASLRMVRNNRCPVCLTGKVRRVSGYSCGWDDRCDNSECGKAYLYPEYPVHPDIPDYLENVLRFGRRVMQAKGELAERQAREVKL